MNHEKVNIQKADEEVQLSHVFDAPRETVFRAWTDPEQLLKWFSPQGTRITYKKIDIHTGGTYHSCIHDPVHGECWCKGTYIEVTFPEKLVYTIEMTDENGNDVNPIQGGKNENWPAKTLLTITFTEVDEKTHLSLHQTVSADLAKRTGALPSWISMLEKLASLLHEKR